MGRDSSGGAFHCNDGLPGDGRGDVLGLRVRSLRVFTSSSSPTACCGWEYLFSTMMTLKGEISNYIILLVKVGGGGALHAFTAIPSL